MEEKALNVWRGMIRRCHKPNDTAYKSYGAKGIWVCDRWRFGDKENTGFDCFLEDVGLPPSDEHHLHRIDNDKGYFEGNVAWVPNRIHGAIHGLVQKVVTKTTIDTLNDGEIPRDVILPIVNKIYSEAWQEYLRRLDDAGL